MYSVISCFFSHFLPTFSKNIYFVLLSFLYAYCLEIKTFYINCCMKIFEINFYMYLTKKIDVSNVVC